MHEAPDTKQHDTSGLNMRCAGVKPSRIPGLPQNCKNIVVLGWFTTRYFWAAAWVWGGSTGCTLRNRHKRYFIRLRSFTTCARETSPAAAKSAVGRRRHRQEGVVSCPRTVSARRSAWTGHWTASKRRLMHALFVGFLFLELGEARTAT